MIGSHYTGEGPAKLESYIHMSGKVSKNYTVYCPWMRFVTRRGSPVWLWWRRKARGGRGGLIEVFVEQPLAFPRSGNKGNTHKTNFQKDSLNSLSRSFEKKTRRSRSR